MSIGAFGAFGAMSIVEGRRTRLEKFGKIVFFHRFQEGSGTGDGEQNGRGRAVGDGEDGAALQPRGQAPYGARLRHS